MHSPDQLNNHFHTIPIHLSQSEFNLNHNNQHISNPQMSFQNRNAYHHINNNPITTNINLLNSNPNLFNTNINPTINPMSSNMKMNKMEYD